MKKQLLLISGTLMLTAALLPASVSAANWTDDSQKPDTLWYTEHKSATEYTLTKPEELAGLSILVNTYKYTFDGKTVKLGNDIDLTATVDDAPVLWTPIGNYIRNRTEIYFQGTFDGQGHTIDGVNVSGDVDCSGFFGALNKAIIRNVTIGEKSKFTTTKTVAVAGALAASVIESRIIGCTNRGEVSVIKNQNIHIGGLVGAARAKCYVANSRNYGNIDNGGYVGGICGYIQADTLVNCVNYGEIKEASNKAGGLTGYGYGDYQVLNCINAGKVINGGGIIGQAAGGMSAAALKGRMANCVNLGEVSGTGHSIVMTTTHTTLIRNYSIDNGLSAGTIPFTVLTDEQLKSEKLAKELTLGAGYENQRTGGTLGAVTWTSVAGEYVALGNDAATQTYRVSIVPTLLGELSASPLASDDAMSLYSEAGAQVVLAVTAYQGYNFSGFKLGEEAKTGNTFAMPAEDVKIELLFNAGTATTWADMPQHAVASTDYKLDGTAYEVYTAKGLAYVASKVNAGETNIETTVKLMSDIDLGVNNAAGETLLWVPIGTETNKFGGIFDGNDFSIQNMYINATIKYAGLFGSASGAEIKNVSIAANCKLSSTQQYFGAVAGGISNTVITNCHNAAAIEASGMYVGGIVGDAIGAQTVISLCSNTGTITSTNMMVGGIAARLGDNNAVCTIYNCFNTGALSGKGTVGGLVAMLQSPTAGPARSLIANSYNTGVITSAANAAGGIVAMINAYSEVKNCINSATVTTAVKYAGGIVGQNTSKDKPGIITRSYYLENTVTAATDLNSEGNALTETEMYGSAIATEMSGFAGYLNNIELTTYLQWTSSKTSCPTFGTKNTVSTPAYIFTVEEPEHGTYTLTKPVAVLAKDSATFFLKRNIAVELAVTPDNGYEFEALRVNGVLLAEGVKTFRTAAENTTVEIVFRSTGGTGITDMDLSKEVQVWATDATLHMILAQSASVLVSTMDGRIVMREQMQEGTYEYALPRGFYIVKVENTSYKVYVR